MTQSDPAGPQWIAVYVPQEGMKRSTDPAGLQWIADRTETAGGHARVAFVQRLESGPSSALSVENVSP